MVLVDNGGRHLLLHLGVLLYIPEESADRQRRILYVYLCLSADLFCSSVNAIEASEIEIGRPPRQNRVAEAVAILSKRAFVYNSSLVVPGLGKSGALDRRRYLLAGRILSDEIDIID